MYDRIATSRRRRRLAIAAVLAATTATSGLATAHAAAPDATPAGGDVCAAVPAGNRFVDVDDDDAAAEAIACLAHARITSGVSADRYGPEQDVTREQMASFLGRTADIASVLDPDDRIALLPGSGPARFSDLDHSSPHAANIIRIAEAGIAKGGPGSLPAHVYGPGQQVSRAQMASFVRRTIEYTTGAPLPAGPDRFGDDAGDDHESAINALAHAGIVDGYEDGTYRPAAPVSRRAMAWYLTRTLAHLHRVGAVEALPASLPPRGTEGSAVVDRYGEFGPLVAVAPNRDEDGAAGSGCRPGDDERLPDGIWMAEITDVTSTDVGLDLLCFRTNESADIDFDYETINDSDLVRRMPVAADARFFLMTYPPAVFVGTPVEFWRFDDPVSAGDFLADRGYHDDADVALAWVLVEGGEVVEVYTPSWTAA